MSLKGIIEGITGLGIVVGSIGIFSSVSYEIHRSYNNPYKNLTVVNNYQDAKKTLRSLESMKNETKSDFPYNSPSIRPYLQKVIVNKNNLENAIKSVEEDIKKMEDTQTLKDKSKYDEESKKYELIFCLGVLINSASMLVWNRPK